MYGGEREEPPLRDLMSRVVENGKAYARAELTVAKAIVAGQVQRWRLSVVLAVVALLLAQAALTVLVGALGMTIALWLGPAAGLACGAAVGLIAAGLMVWIAIARLSKAGS